MNIEKRVAYILAGIVFVIAAVHWTASWYDWYDLYDWIDIPMHMMGGVFIGVVFYYVFVLRFKILPRHGALTFLPFIILGVGFVMLVGVGWEWYEFFADVVINKQYTVYGYPGYVHADTMFDLLNDMIGGTVALAVLWLAFERTRKTSA